MMKTYLATFIFVSLPLAVVPMATAGEVRCWGQYNTWGQNDVPAGLQNPTQIAASATTSAAITDRGFVWWGGGANPARVPRWNDPKKLKLAGWTAYAIVDHHVKSWENWETDFSQVEDPDDYAVSNGGICTLKLGVVKCFTSNPKVNSVPLDLVDVKQIISGQTGGNLYDDYACALMENRMRCWGDISLDVVVPGSKSISGGRDKICASTGDGYQCWDPAEGRNNIEVHGIEAPLQIFNNYEDGICMLNSHGLACSGYVVRPPVDLKKLRAVVSGPDHFCAITD